ncbi:MAG: DUF3352 domain-containing protein [Actinomycetota bacterium]
MSFDTEGQSVHLRSEEVPGLSSQGSRKWIGAAGAVVMVVALVFGGMTALKMLGGGGAQPEDVFPNSAIVFAKLDLNPSAGQKLAAYRLASSFPKVKDKVSSKETSVKESIFSSVLAGNRSWGLDYKKDVEPWLGDRIGVGVFPAGGADSKPEIALAIAFTDQSAAKAALDKAIANATTQVEMVGYAFADGYVVLSDTTAHATALVQAGKVSPLGLPAWSTYSDDVKSLGSDQIGVAWVDLAAAYKAIPKDQLKNGPLGGLQGTTDPKNATGRFVSGLHVDPSYLELTGRSIELKGAGPLTSTGGVNQTKLMSSLPSDVLGAATATGFGKAAAALYAGLIAGSDTTGLKPMMQRLGLGSATDLETLLGTETGIAVGGTSDQPQFAVRTRSADSAASLALAIKVFAAAPVPGLTVRKLTDPEGILVGTGSDLTAAMSDPSGGRLGADAAFRQVTPDLGQANFAVYVNLSKVLTLVAKDNPKEAASLAPFNALGLTVAGGPEPSYRLRISVR